jgi:hypothetical protein
VQRGAAHTFGFLKLLKCLPLFPVVLKATYRIRLEQCFAVIPAVQSWE